MPERRVPHWINGYMTYTEDTNEASLLYLRWSAASAIAAALMRKCYVEWDGRKYPNMYVVLVGPPGARKGTAMKPAIEMLQRIGIFLAANCATKEAVCRTLCKRLDMVTVEGAGKPDFHSSLTIFSEELTVFLGYHNAELMTFLSNWYDCPEYWSYDTKHQGTDEVRGVFVNLIGATTPKLLASSIPQDTIGSGLASRMIFVYAANKHKTIIVPVKTEKEHRLEEDLTLDLGRIAAMAGEFHPTEQWIERYSNWYTKQDKEPAFQHTFAEGYTARRQTHMFKLSMILSAARGSDMLLEGQDFQYALCMLEEVEAVMGNVFADFGRNKDVAVLHRMQHTIAAANKISLSELLRFYYQDVDKRTLAEILTTLEGMHFCSITREGNETFIEYTPRKAK